MATKPGAFVLTILTAFAPSLEAAEAAEVQNLLEKQFAADPTLAESMIRGMEGFWKIIDQLAQRSTSTVFKDGVLGLKQGLDQEAAAHNITLA